MTKFKNYINKFNIETILKLNKKGYNLQKISKEIDIPYRRLSEMCNYYNVQIYKNFIIPVNHDYFENITTEKQAYILGYIIADGCISIEQRKNKLSKRLMFLSSIDDEEVIELIKNEISKNSNISRINNKKGSINRKEQLSLRISSDKLINDLIEKYDIKPNKTCNSQNFKLPNILDNLKRHLIRGIFDGDGCVSGRSKSLSFTLNSELLCNDIYYEIKKIIPNLTCNIKKVQGKTCIYYRLKINVNNSNKNLIIDYLYKDSECFLTRKKLKF